MTTRDVFVTGGTGYLGRKLVPSLLLQGHRVRALVRSGSEWKVPSGCRVVIGDPLHRDTFADQVAGCDTFVQMVGVPHPSPRKARQFLEIDLRSALESVATVAPHPGVHFVYVSVAQPAPVMRAYQAARRQAEDAIQATGLPRTIIRPWYVLGPGHQWPYALIPLYAALEALPPTRASAQRLGLVTLSQMVATLVHAIENPPARERVIEVPDIRRISAGLNAPG